MFQSPELAYLRLIGLTLMATKILDYPYDFFSFIIIFVFEFIIVIFSEK